MTTRVVLFALTLANALGPKAWAQRSCESLTGLTLSGATITAAAEVAAARGTPPNPGIPVAPFEVPAHCRVQGVARPSDDSEIRFEVWLPAGERWNGKFEQVGNGGYAGVIPIASLSAGVARGFATAGTDDGHIGANASFAIGHPEKVIDFGHRAVHQTAIHARAVIEAFYGKPPTHSYFFGCSDGGREALMEAQRYPEDFDGIVVGAPANNWTRLLTSGVWNWKALNETPGSMILASKLPAIQAAVVTACDRLDGVTDGLIEDPSRCRFRPSTLRCAGADGASCLTQAQVAALEKIYAGPISPQTGDRIYPGAVAGTEALPGNWNPWLVGTSPAGLPLQAWFGTSFYSSMVFEDPKWDYRTIDFDRDLAVALEKAGKALDSNDPDLRRFRDRGGKMIQYHGWGDAAIPASGSIDYYQRVKKTLAGSQRVEDFYRLFMVPGMGHCAGGMGPNDFGNLALGVPSRSDPERDIHSALERWVEHGIAPERIIAEGIRPGEPPTDPAKGVKMTRPICAYPRTARYRGTGSTDDAANFSCSER